MQPEILADENVDYRIVKNLRNEGFKVISILEDYRGLSDKKILELSRNQRALLLTGRAEGHFPYYLSSIFYSPNFLSHNVSSQCLDFF